MNVAMIGAGYVGLTTGACFASLGYKVCCVDIDEGRVADLEKGIMPIYEPGLAELIIEGRKAGRLRFSADIGASVADADFVFLAVGTPSTIDGDIDLSFVDAAARGIAPFLPDSAVVVIKSTVVAGTAKTVADVISSKRAGRRITVASNPEFLREGSAIADFRNADRIVVGADDEGAANSLKELYRPLIERGVPFVATSTIDAELIKYAANAFLALKIGFINDVANLCENAGGDVTAVAKGIGLDRRIGQTFLQTGPGFGGSCFPKDTRAFAATGKRFDAPQPLIETLINFNDKRKSDLAHRILQVLGATGHAKTVAILGVAFKAETDDVRESAALSIIPILLRAGMCVRAHDPKAQAPARKVLGAGVEWHDDLYAAVNGVDAVVVLTEWDDYRRMNLSRVADLMEGPYLFDFRNLFMPEDAIRHGLVHHSLGRAIGRADKTQVNVRGGGGPALIEVAASPC
ncbi:UDP-glucose/GDP-mannose dehydrogenase family protein [Rhizobium sp. XQZ8]|uniref:UDP-glucose dehydrogenase family protein n=1 Tax=Rhizobium populisoli TaxID=2859785 RepID=UPI001C66B145|nr:UDP-glucose/GDP-mannose dehydrogenase family protein [Rhizobium populisoli]MBW6424876.1 UDP-glucose/GDP-mannose dehydrogenase family protein [Rhizobium populisoli]